MEILTITAVRNYAHAGRHIRQRLLTPGSSESGQQGPGILLLNPVPGIRLNRNEPGPREYRRPRHGM
jgi:hypothetical protein